MHFLSNGKSCSIEVVLRFLPINLESLDSLVDCKHGVFMDGCWDRVWFACSCPRLFAVLFPLKLESRIFSHASFLALGCTLM